MTDTTNALKLLSLRETLFGQRVENSLVDTKQDMAVLYMSNHPEVQKLLTRIPHDGELPRTLEFLAGLLEIGQEEIEALLDVLPDPLRACLHRSADRVFVTLPIIPLEELLQKGDEKGAMFYLFQLGKVAGFKYALAMEKLSVQTEEEENGKRL